MPATSATETTVDLVTRFENTFNTHDVDALMADMSEDCVFEHVAPAAVSFGRHEGQAAVRAVWESLATHFPGYRFDIEDIFGAGDRCACRWSLEWSPPEGGKGTARGVDIFTVRDGKIAEKLTYVTMG
ncbi:MAG TPA: nuclear transport factor 2 family protein [Gemmatimonadales bacterium]|nr:nuclear transport factor 2 family protein [Gemmatimonadales bacterium]